MLAYRKCAAMAPALRRGAQILTSKLQVRRLATTAQPRAPSESKDGQLATKAIPQRTSSSGEHTLQKREDRKLVRRPELKDSLGSPAERRHQAVVQSIGQFTPQLIEAQLALLRAHFAEDEQVLSQRDHKGERELALPAQDKAAIEAVGKNATELARAGLIMPQSLSEVRHAYATLLMRAYDSHFPKGVNISVTRQQQPHRGALVASDAGKMLATRGPAPSRRMAYQSGLALLERIFDELNENFTPSTSQFSLMVSAYGKAGFADKARAKFDAMKEAGVVQDLSAFNTLLQAYVRCDRLDDALAFFAEMKSAIRLEKSTEPGDAEPSTRIVRVRQWHIKPDTYTYTIIIAALGKVGQLTEARKLLTEMEDYKVPPSYVTYSALIDAHGRAGDFAGALEVLESMQLRGFYANAVTFNALMAGAARVGDSTNAVKIMEEMLRNGQTPTESTFVSLLWAYRNSKAATSKDDALEIHNNLRAGKYGPFRPTPSTYLELLSVLGKDVGAADPALTESAKHIEAGIAVYREALEAGFFVGNDELAKKAVVDLRPFARRLDVVPFAIYHHLRALAAEAGGAVLNTHMGAGPDPVPSLAAAAAKAEAKAAVKAAAGVASKAGESFSVVSPPAAVKASLHNVLPGRGLVFVLGISAIVPKDAIVFTEGEGERWSPDKEETLKDRVHAVLRSARPALKSIEDRPGSIRVFRDSLQYWLSNQGNPLHWPGARQHAQKLRLAKGLPLTGALSNGPAGSATSGATAGAAGVADDARVADALSAEFGGTGSQPAAGAAAVGVGPPLGGRRQRAPVSLLERKTDPDAPRIDPGRIGVRERVAAPPRSAAFRPASAVGAAASAPAAAAAPAGKGSDSNVDAAASTRVVERQPAVASAAAATAKSAAPAAGSKELAATHTHEGEAELTDDPDATEEEDFGVIEDPTDDEAHGGREGRPRHSEGYRSRPREGDSPSSASAPARPPLEQRPQRASGAAKVPSSGSQSSRLQKHADGTNMRVVKATPEEIARARAEAEH